MTFISSRRDRKLPCSFFRMVLAAMTAMAFCGCGEIRLAPDSGWWNSSDQLSPSDLGITKYVISSAPGPKEVFVFRTTRVINGKDGDVFESIAYTNGAPVAFSVLLANLDASPFQVNGKMPGAVRLRLPDHGWSDQGGQLTGMSVTGNTLEYNFKQANGDVVKVRCVGTIQTYADAKTRVAALPPLANGSTWTFGTMISPEDKQ